MDLDDVLKVVGAITAVAIALGGVYAYILNLFKDRIKALEGWLSSQSKKLEEFRKRYHDFNNNTAEVILEMNREIAILQTEVENIKEDISELKDSEISNREIAASILASLGELNNHVELLAQRYDLS